MPLYQLTDEKLNELCVYMTQQSYIYYPVQQFFLSDLYTTGCRPRELLMVNRWTYISAANIQLQPLKGNNTRTFTAADISDELEFAIINQVRPYQGLSLRQLTSVTKKILPVPQVQTIEKSAVDYLFRYNYVKQLHLSGMSDADITLKMGWISPLLASAYYSRIMFTTEPVPILETFFIIDADGTRIADSNGDLIIY